MAGGARKENRRERGTAHCMFAVTQTTCQGLTAMPIGPAWWWYSHIQERGSGEGVERERWQAGQH